MFLLNFKPVLEFYRIMERILTVVKILKKRQKLHNFLFTQPNVLNAKNVCVYVSLFYPVMNLTVSRLRTELFLTVNVVITVKVLLIKL